MKPRDKLRHDSDNDYKRKRQLLSPDLDQHQIKLALCRAALYLSNAKSPTVIVQKLGGNGHQHTPLAVVAKQGFVQVTYADMVHRNKTSVMPKLKAVHAVTFIILRSWYFLQEPVHEGKLADVVTPLTM